MARVATECFGALKTAPRRIALPDVPCPTSRALTRTYYRGASEIVEAASAMLGRSLHFEEQRAVAHDVPGEWFKCPFCPATNGLWPWTPTRSPHGLSLRHSLGGSLKFREIQGR